MIPATVKNLVFDLGGVIINLSLQKAYKAFSALSQLSEEEVTMLAKTRNEFLLYETGALTDAEFRNFIRESMNIQASDSEIDFAWNAMLLNIPMERLNVLLQLRQRYTVILLSNTNEIHKQAFTKILFTTTKGLAFNTYFHTEYYSHHMAMRKPDEAIYEFVLKQNNLKANQTLFFDDTQTNLDGAGRVGIQTFHVTNADELFKELATR
jgi:glucose-1-phosphatase